MCRISVDYIMNERTLQVRIRYKWRNGFVALNLAGPVIIGLVYRERYLIGQRTYCGMH